MTTSINGGCSMQSTARKETQVDIINTVSYRKPLNMVLKPYLVPVVDVSAEDLFLKKLCMLSLP